MPNISMSRLQELRDASFKHGYEEGRKAGHAAAMKDYAAAEETKRIQAVTNLLQEGGKMMSKAGWLLRSHTKQQGR